MILAKQDQSLLIETALESIQCGITKGNSLEIDLEDLPASLKEKRATFVTLKRHGELRGCVGVLEAQDPLIRSVAQNAFNAAFRDARFPGFTRKEFAGLQIHISILSPISEIICNTEQELLFKLRPEVDGLVIECLLGRAAFLPVMWERLPDPRDFLVHLKRKAGLADNYWSPDFQAFSFITECSIHSEDVLSKERPVERESLRQP